MSDLEDFVTKPKRLKTYKRRKRGAVLECAPPELEVGDVCKVLFASSPGDRATGHVAHSNTCVKRQCVSNTATDKTPSVSKQPTESHMSDLERFLENQSSLHMSQESASLFASTEFVIEKDENSPPPSSRKKLSFQKDTSNSPLLRSKKEISENFELVKTAADILCNKSANKHLKQSSLKGLIKPQEVTMVTHPSLKGLTRQDSKVQEKSVVNKQPKQCLSISDTENKLSSLKVGKQTVTQTNVVKRLVKQAGTNQLDLGAMFGLKPKEAEPKEAVVNKRWCKDGSKKKVPFYKWISGTTFIVDGFNFGDIPKCTAYFLSHFHSDHYMGLCSSFSSVVYCSQITSNYLLSRLKVPPDCVKALELDKTYHIQGVDVTLIPANHCPGAVLFLFSSSTIGNILHTGDFRFDRTMLEHPGLRNKIFDHVYLDTTYFNPAYSFPPQSDVIQFMVNEAAGFSRQTLVVCGSYTIGKERLVQSLAETLHCKICVSQTKLDLLQLQDNPQLVKRLVKSKEAQLHLVPMRDIKTDSLAGLLAQVPAYTEVVGIKPTGWTNKQNGPLSDIIPVRSGAVRIYNVPYSEHSSYTELEAFCKSIKVKKIISTVLPRTKEERDFMFEKIKLWTQ